jgi:hypothetical protein
LGSFHGSFQKVAGSVKGSSSAEIALSTSSCTGKVSTAYSHSSGSTAQMAPTSWRTALRRGAVLAQLKPAAGKTDGEGKRAGKKGGKKKKKDAA